MSDKRRSEIPELDALRKSLLNAATPRRTPQTRVRRRTALTAASVSFVLVIALAVGLSLHGSGRALTLDEAAATIARAALDSPGVEAGKTTYVRSRFRSADTGYSVVTGTYYAFRTVDTESWYSGGKTGLVRWTLYPLAFPNERARKVHLKSTGVNNLTRRDKIKHVVVCKTSTAARLSQPTGAALRLGLPKGAAFPTDPEQLYKLLRQRMAHRLYGPGVGTGPDGNIWYVIVGALQGSGLNLAPDQRAALAGAMAKVAGVRTLGQVEDPIGNPSIGFERVYRQGKMRARVYFSTSDARTTYYDETIMKPSKFDASQMPQGRTYYDVPAGTVVLAYSLLDYKHVDHTPKLRLSTGGGLAADYCRALRRKR
jgi:hypothetical protein